jgi:hypothetical protein
MKTFLILLVIGLVVLGIWFMNRVGENQVALINSTATLTPNYTINYSNSVSPTPSVSETPVATTPGMGGGDDVNFSRRGTLLIDTAGLKPATWYLNYNIGSSNYLTELTFPPDSACTINGETSLCSDNDVNLSSGMTVRVQGMFSNNMVEVVSLEVLSVSGAVTSPSVNPVTPTPTTTLNPTITPSPLPGASVSPTFTPTPTFSPSPTVTFSPTPSLTPTLSPGY